VAVKSVKVAAVHTASAEKDQRLIRVTLTAVVIAAVDTKRLLKEARQNLAYASFCSVSVLFAPFLTKHRVSEVLPLFLKARADHRLV